MVAIVVAVAPRLVDVIKKRSLHEMQAATQWKDRSRFSRKRMISPRLSRLPLVQSLSSHGAGRRL